MTTLPSPIMRDDTEHGRKYCTLADALAYGAARAAEEREWWREMAEQLIACHEEPTCPAVTLVRERLEKTK